MDTLSAAERSARMSLVRSANTKPELALRRLVHGMGFRYRLHRRRIVGRPDIANSSRRIAIFLHGCFWHRHDCPSGRRMPKSRIKFWSQKFERNVRRDREVRKLLHKDGWRVVVVWECQLRFPVRLRRRLECFLDA
jgi:DNA mismatch endonuclease (patch repair protein)